MRLTQSAAPAPEVSADAGLVRLREYWLHDRRVETHERRGEIIMSTLMAPATARALAANLLAAADAAERDPERA